MLEIEKVVPATIDNLHCATVIASLQKIFENIKEKMKQNDMAINEEILKEIEQGLVNNLNDEINVLQDVALGEAWNKIKADLDKPSQLENFTVSQVVALLWTAVIDENADSQKTSEERKQIFFEGLKVIARQGNLDIRDKCNVLAGTLQGIHPDVNIIANIGVEFQKIAEDLIHEAVFKFQKNLSLFREVLFAEFENERHVTVKSHLLHRKEEVINTLNGMIKGCGLSYEDYSDLIEKYLRFLFCVINY